MTEIAAEVALRTALLTTLGNDDALVALLGGRHIHDGAPRGARHPFVGLDAIESRPIGDIPSEVSEHRITMTVVSRAAQRGEAATIADRVVRLLHNVPMGVQDRRIVNLRRIASNTRPLRSGRGFSVRIEFRAVSEPNGV